ncbi:MAG: MATE family efflux transporter [Ruminococcus sp.]|nr:MATE family efflux transporter [Ruminococcus sp.]
MNKKLKISQYDKMTKTPVSRLVIALSVPSIISMLITNVYNLVDTAFVGQLGNSASGAVGIVFGYMSILQAVGFMFGQGSGSIISRMLGNKDTENAGIIASTGFFGSLILSGLLAVISYIFLNPLVFLLGSTSTIAPFAKDYLIYILISAPFITASFVMNNILRYEGKATLGMIGLMTGAVLNMCCDPVFMFVFDMGIAGAGLSTALSQFVGFSVLLSMFLRGKTQCRFSFSKISKNYRCFFDIIATGFPSMLRQGLNSCTTVLMNSEAAVYGDAAVAAMSIVTRISFFVFSVALGVGQGYQPVSGFNYGAGKYSRVRKGFRFTVLLSEGIIIIMSAIVILLSGSLIKIFRNDVDVIDIGTRALILQCIAQLVLPFCMVVEMQYQSTGGKLGATILSSLRGGVIFIPLLLILSHLRGLSGIQEAQPLSVVIALIPSVVFAISFFRRLPLKDKIEEI